MAFPTSQRLVMLVSLFLVGLVPGAFFLGRMNPRRSHLSNFIIHRVGTNIVVIDPNFPLDGLGPMLYHPKILRRLREGDTNSAISELETLMSLAVVAAKDRRPLLPEYSLKTVDKVLGKIADYRQQFPPSSAHLNYPALREADNFLKSFASPSPQVTEAALQPFVGKTVAELLDAQRLTLSDCRFIDEPPGVLRELSLPTAQRGRRLRVALKGQPSSFSGQMLWSPDDVRQAQIVELRYADH